MSRLCVFGGLNVRGRGWGLKVYGGPQTPILIQKPCGYTWLRAVALWLHVVALPLVHFTGSYRDITTSISATMVTHSYGTQTTAPVILQYHPVIADALSCL